MNHSLKIAIYSGEIPSTTFIERLVTGLSRTPHTVYLFGAKTRNVSYNDSVIVVGYSHNRFRKFLNVLKYALLLSLFKSQDKRKLDQMLRSQSNNLLYSKVKSYPVLWHRPDIFHLQWAKGLEEWAWVQEFGIKLVLSLRGAHINYSPIGDAKLADMYRSYFPKVDGFHAVSEAIAKEALNYGASKNKIKVVYSGLKLHEFTTSAQKQNAVFQILSVGRPHWKKGYPYALDACKLLKNANIAFQHTIVGGALDIELLYQIEDLGLQTDVSLMEQKSFEEVKRLIQSTDLLFLPSVEEGIANVVLEAMALKTLVLSTDCGGMGEVLTDSANGFLVPIRDAQAIADAVIGIQKLSTADVLAIKQRAILKIEAQHSEERMVEGMLALYHSLMSKE